MKRILSYLVPTCIVAIGGASYLTIRSFQSPQVAAPDRVVLGRDYYVTATVIEVTEQNSAGESWDTYNSTGPDLQYEIYWRENRIFKSETKSDTFLGKWSNAELDVKKIAVNRGVTSLDSLQQGARVNVRTNEQIELRVYDSDAVDRELVGTQSFALPSLIIGDTTYQYKEPGIKRIVLRVRDMSLPPDVIR